jgi:hypothetical protein
MAVVVKQSWGTYAYVGIAVSYFADGIYKAVSSKISYYPCRAIILDIRTVKSVEIIGGDAVYYRLNGTLHMLHDGLVSEERTPNFLMNCQASYNEIRYDTNMDRFILD